MRSLFSTQRNGNPVEWFEEEPRKRTMLIGPMFGSIPGAPDVQIKRVDVPRIVYAVQLDADRKFASLHTFSALAPIQSPADMLTYLSHRNYLDDSTGKACLGSAHGAVVAGELEPAEAFWNTTFLGCDMKADASPMFRIEDFADKQDRDTLTIDTAPATVATAWPTPTVGNAWYAPAGMTPNFAINWRAVWQPTTQRYVAVEPAVIPPAPPPTEYHQTTHGISDHVSERALNRYAEQSMPEDHDVHRVERGQSLQVIERGVVVGRFTGPLTVRIG